MIKQGCATRGVSGMAKQKTKLLIGCVVILAALSSCGRNNVILPGERVSLRPTAELAVQNASAGIALGAAVSNAEWAQRGGNASHHMPHLALSEAPSLRWSVNIGTGDRGRSRLTSEPVIANGVIYTLDSGAHVRAYGPGGALIWESTVNPITDQPGDGFGGGLAVVGERLIAATGFGEVLALNASSGDILWRYGFDAPFHAAPSIVDGMIVAMARDETAYGLSLDGNLSWTVAGAGASSPRILGGASAAAGGGTIVLPFASGRIVGATAGGQARWSQAVNAGQLGAARSILGDYTGGPIVADGRVYIGNHNGEMAAISAQTGTPIWSQPIGAMSRAAVIGGAVFVVDDTARLIRLEAANGRAIWATELPLWRNPNKRRGYIAHYGPVVAGGRLWVAGADGQLRGFDPQSGAQTFTATIPGGAASAPVVAAGVLYVLGRNGTLNAFQ